MKKVLIGLLVVVILAVGAGTFFVVGKLDGVIADAIRTEGTAALGTTVAVSDVKTDLGEGLATISGLAIANPAGYQSANAISIDSFSARVDYRSQIIEDITINQPVINAELIGTRSNFQDLLANIPESSPTEEQSSGDDVSLTINKLALRKATVNLSSDKLGQTSFVMDDFVLNNVTGTAEQISEEISNALINHVTTQVTGHVQAEAIAMAKEAAIEKAKEVVNEKIQSEVTEELGEKLGDKLGVKVKDLKFKFKKD